MKKLMFTIASLLAIHTANAQAPVIPAGHSFQNGVGIGMPVGPNCPSNAALHIKADSNSAYSSGNGQQLIYCETSNAPGDNLRISNGKGGVGGTFVPIISGNVETDSSAVPIHLWGSTSAAKDVTTGAPMMKFMVSTNFNPATTCGTFGSIGNITKRPLFQWGNGNLAPLMTIIPTSTIAGDAYLGLGTTTPAYKMDIAIPATTNGFDGIRISNASTSGATLRLKTTSTGGSEWALFSAGSTASAGAGNFALYNFTSSAYYMTVNKTTGNVGIGTAAPAASHKLHVKPGANLDPVRFEGLKAMNDSVIVTVDANGVLHKRSLSTIATSGITNSCTTIKQIPVVNSATGNLGCGIMTDDGSHIGISTTAPTAKLHVMSPLGFSGASLRCERNDGTNQTNALDVILTSNGLPSAALGAGTVNFISRNLTPGATPDMAFSANNVDQQLIIKNNGDVGIGTNPTTGLYKLDVNGMIRSTSLLVTSDAKYKKDIQPIKNANEIINGLQGVTYNWKKDEFKSKNFSAQQQLGFIAQEVEKVLPQAVTKDANGDYAVNYIEIIPVLTEAMKAQNEKIDALENQLAEIKAMLQQNTKPSSASDVVNEVKASIYPNPIANGTFTIEVFSRKEGTAKVSITDMQGNVVLSENFATCANCTNQFSMNASSLSNGMYVVNMMVDGRMIQEKISIAK